MPNEYIIRFKDGKSICKEIDATTFSLITSPGINKTLKNLYKINEDTIINLEYVEYITKRKEKEPVDELLGQKYKLMGTLLYKFDTMDRQEWGKLVQAQFSSPFLDMKARKYFFDKDNNCLIDRGPSNDTTQFCIMANLKL